MVDFHSHILPAVDDGSRDVEESIALLNMLSQQGIKTVCATPHFNANRQTVEEFLEARNSAYNNLKESLPQDAPQIRLGAEVAYYEGIERLEGLKDLCIEGTNLLLLEMPFTRGDWGRELYRTVHEIRKKGITPVLAHVDRYPKHSIEQLFDMGLCGQINCDSLSKVFKPKHLLRWVESGRIVAFGSDLHGNDPKGYAPFTKVMSTYADHVARIMETTARLLQNATEY